LGTFRTITACIGISLFLFCAGCGVVALPVGGVSPSISQVYPRTITAGSQAMTLKVTGSNFNNAAVIQWNGNALPTSVVDANTLAASVQSTDLASPSVAALTVHDKQTGQNSNSVQVTVAPGNSSNHGHALAIATTSLPAGTAGAAYSAGLAATGGTLSYAWTITSGRLPLGLSLDTANGAISGTPMVSGTYNFTATVTDSSSPAQTASVTLTIAVAASTSTQANASLAITTATLPSGTDGMAYSTPLHASGGTPAYTWSISAGSLPSGLTLAASSGVISGTPSATGTFNFTIAVADNSNPAQAQSLATAITVATAPAAPTGPGTTWYVRPDGGTRYSSIMTSGQCDGQADAPYPGTGTNQHCAFGDVRWLWQDGSYNTSQSAPSWGWVISGGDTVIIRGSIETGVSWRVGWNNSSGALDPATGLYYGLQGEAYDSGIPVPPSGTAAQPTQILGENYAACTSQSARTQIHGGWSVFSVLNLRGASYVHVGCLDLTDFSNCGRDMDTVGCVDGQQDFARYGIMLSNTSTHITLTDVRIHGMASDGMYGPTGDGFMANDLAIIGNADAGWNTDAGDGQTGVGSFFVQNFNISWNGCVEEYPIVDPLPYFSCRDDVNGGYGDGFGTASVASPAPGWQVHFDHGIASYNTQDGLDAKHVSGEGSTMTVTRVLAYGNEGQQLKVGDGASAIVQNSVFVGNCEALGQTIPGRPSPTNDKVNDLCRAANTAIVLDTTPGKPSVFQNNTVYTMGAVGLEVEYATSDFGPTNVLLFNNNVFVGFYNPGYQVNPAPIYSAGGVDGAGGSQHAIPAVLTNPGASWSNNATIGQKVNWACPQPGESNALCTDLGLADETYHPYGYGNMAPASGSSAVVGAGVTIPGLTLDYTGVIRPTPPSMGAYEKPQAP